MMNSPTVRLPFLFYKRQSNVRKTAPGLVQPALSPAEVVADAIMQLFETYGAAPCEGGQVSQTSHMVQCAMLAMEGMSDLPVIIGALLHDIGDLLKHDQGAEAMASIDRANQESAGASYLRRNGFSERVCAIAAHHVAAKRYLLAVDKTYQNHLAPASAKALCWLGGPMTLEERASFEKHMYFTDIIKVARWDAEAKDSNAALLPVAWFRRLLWDHLFLRVV